MSADAEFLSYQAELERETKARTAPLRVAMQLMISAGMLMNMVGMFLEDVGPRYLFVGLCSGFGLGLITGAMVLVLLIHNIRKQWKRDNPVGLYLEQTT